MQTQGPNDEQTVIVPHSEGQERAIFATKRHLVLGCGTQYGKTTVGAVRMKRKIFEHCGPNERFLITAPTYKVLHQSTLPPFLKLMAGCGTYLKKDDVFECSSGERVFCRTETDPDSIIGITNVRHVWGDEAGKYRKYFWENIQARADFCGASIDLTTSPYSLNWIYRELIKPAQAGLRDDVELVLAASWENPYHSLHDPIAREAKRRTMDSRRFKMIYGGEWGRPEGLVYDCFSETENMVDAFQLPQGTRYYGGIDWGFYPDPFVLKVRAITPDGRHYGVSEFAANLKTPSDIVQICRTRQGMYGMKAVYCDPSQPGMIEELCRNNVPAMGADNDIRRGIAVHYELIKTRRWKSFRGAEPLTLDELEHYHYPEEKDLGPDDHARELKPVDQKNHGLDVDRYISVMTTRSGELLKPTVREEVRSRTKDPEAERIKRLLRPKGNAHHEDWQ